MQPPPDLTPRRSRFLLDRVIAMALLCTLLVGAASAAAPADAAAAADVVGVTGAVSDNYKARWNADPSVQERRIWLSMDSIAAGGTGWAPAAPAAVTVTPDAGIDVVGADGRAGRLELAVTAGAAEWARVRADPSGRWGPLLSIPAGDSLRSHPLLVSATVVSGGATVATGTLEYRFEPAFADAGPEHIEHNGPSGRWYVGGTAIATDWEPPMPPGTRYATPPGAHVPPAPSTTTGSGSTGNGTSAGTAPRIVRVLVPLRTARRLVSVRISARVAAGSRMASVRVSVGAHGWARWVPVAKAYPVTLPRAAGRIQLRFQVRDSAGRVSAPVGRVVRCTC